MPRVSRKRHFPLRLVRRDEVELDAEAPAARDLGLELLLMLGKARDLERPRLMIGQRLAGLPRETLDLPDGQHREPRHELGPAHLRCQSGGARRGLRSQVVHVHERHAELACPRQMESYARSERARTDHDNLGFADHLVPRPRCLGLSELVPFGMLRQLDHV